jgi:anti-anti-sigma regulatory factor
VTTPKSPKNRKSSARARLKRATVSAARPVPAAILTQTDHEARGRICVQLEPGLEIKDAEGVHRRLLEALGGGRAVIVDVGRLHAVDAAGAQLLLAFQDEAGRRGVTIEFRGESAALTHTLAVLGLRDKFPFVALHG